MSVFVKSFCWYDVLFNTKAWQAFVARQKEMQKDRVTLENEVHQLQAANRDYVRKLLDRDQKLDECRNRIAVLSGAAHAENLPYQVKGTHGQTQGPKSDVRSGDMASDSNRRRRNDRDPLESPQPDNSALLTATAFAVVDSDFRAHVVDIPQQQCSPVYSAPEPAPSRSESYSSPSRSESYDSPSSNNDSSPGGCD